MVNRPHIGAAVTKEPYQNDEIVDDIDEEYVTYGRDEPRASRGPMSAIELDEKNW
jgi:hypothetical protein